MCGKRQALTYGESCLRLQSDGAFFSELSVFLPRDDDERGWISDSCARINQKAEAAQKFRPFLELQIVENIPFRYCKTCEEYRFLNYKSALKTVSELKIVSKIPFPNYKPFAE